MDLEAKPMLILSNVSGVHELLDLVREIKKSEGIDKQPRSGAPEQNCPA
jgi:hypothetical protein